MATKAKSEYWELLRDPRWQKKRLEVMQRDEFSCSYCGSSNKTLNVHHTYYEKGNAPWEYPTESLHCLCEGCHDKFEAINLEFKRQLGRLHPSDVVQLLGYAQAIQAKRDYCDELLKFEITTYEHAQGFVDGFCCVATPEELIDVLDGSNLTVMDLDVVEGQKAIFMAQKYGLTPESSFKETRVFGIGYETIKRLEEQSA